MSFERVRLASLLAAELPGATPERLAALAVLLQAVIASGGAGLAWLERELERRGLSR